MRDVLRAKRWGMTLDFCNDNFGFEPHLFNDYNGYDEGSEFQFNWSGDGWGLSIGFLGSEIMCLDGWRVCLNSAENAQVPKWAKYIDDEFSRLCRDSWSFD